MHSGAWRYRRRNAYVTRPWRSCVYWTVIMYVSVTNAKRKNRKKNHLFYYFYFLFSILAVIVIIAPRRRNRNELDNWDESGRTSFCDGSRSVNKTIRLPRTEFRIAWKYFHPVIFPCVPHKGGLITFTTRLLIRNWNSLFHELINIISLSVLDNIFEHTIGRFFSLYLSRCRRDKWRR